MLPEQKVLQISAPLGILPSTTYPDKITPVAATPFRPFPSSSPEGEHSLTWPGV